MSTLRYDPTTNDWILFAPNRAQRPRQEAHETDRPPVEFNHCPFCPGNESHTPPEIYAVRRRPVTNVPGWEVRVLPNKFPALRIEEDEASLTETQSFFRYRGGCGAHEVIIESPEHKRILAEQPVAQIESVLKTLQLRHNDLLRDHRMQSIIIFKNHGEGAGTSLQHPHFQLIATPVVPHMMRTKMAIAADYFDMTGRSLYEVMMKEELAAETRILAVSEKYVALLPYASHVPFEIWILPREFRSSFGTVPADELRPLAEMLKDVLSRLAANLDNPDFNLTIDSVPRGDEDQTYFLWHIRILPRLTTPAGFEMGSGMSINTVLPEDANCFLRTNGEARTQCYDEAWTASTQ